MPNLISRYLKPDLYCTDLDELDFRLFKEAGYKLILVDVDNTLARHGSDRADSYARRAIDRAAQAGLDCRIISNAGKKRIEAYAATLDIPYVAWARKPSPKSIIAVCQDANVLPEEAVMIGDQILTDVICAQRAGCLSVLVKPRGRKEPWHIRLKRQVEKLVFWRYKKSLRRPARPIPLAKKKKGRPAKS